jgi:hypothetical protein
MKYLNKGKKMKMDDICTKLGEMQKKGEIKYSVDLSEKDGDWLGATFSKLRKKFKDQ